MADISYTPLPVIRNFVEAYIQDKPQSTRMRQAVVTGISGAVPGALSIRLGGSDISIPHVRKLSSYVATVDDTVWVAQTGPDLLVVGKVATDNLPDPRLPRGIVAYSGTATSPTFTNLIHVLIIGNVPFVAGRAYEVAGYVVARANTDQAVLTTWAESFVRIDAVNRGMDRKEMVSKFVVGNQHMYPKRIWLPTATQNLTVALSIQLNTVPSGAQGTVVGSSSMPATLTVTDIGLAP